MQESPYSSGVPHAKARVDLDRIGPEDGYGQLADKLKEKRWCIPMSTPMKNHY